MRYRGCQPKRFDILRSVGLMNLMYEITEDGADAASRTTGMDEDMAFHSR